MKARADKQLYERITAIIPEAQSSSSLKKDIIYLAVGNDKAMERIYAAASEDRRLK